MHIMEFMLKRSVHEKTCVFIERMNKEPPKLKTPGPSFLVFCRTKSKAVVDTTLKLEKEQA